MKVSAADFLPLTWMAVVAGQLRHLRLERGDRGLADHGRRSWRPRRSRRHRRRRRDRAPSAGPAWLPEGRPDRPLCRQRAEDIVLARGRVQAELLGQLLLKGHEGLLVVERGQTAQVGFIHQRGALDRAHLVVFGVTDHRTDAPVGLVGQLSSRPALFQRTLPQMPSARASMAVISARGAAWAPGRSTGGFAVDQRTHSLWAKDAAITAWAIGSHEGLPSTVSILPCTAGRR